MARWYGFFTPRQARQILQFFAFWDFFRRFFDRFWFFLEWFFDRFFWSDFLTLFLLSCFGCRSARCARLPPSLPPSACHLKTALSILGLQLLGQKISNSGEICKILQDQIDSSSVIPYKLFTSSSAAQTLGSCSLKLNTHASQVQTDGRGNFPTGNPGNYFIFPILFLE